MSARERGGKIVPRQHSTQALRDSGLKRGLEGGEQANNEATIKVDFIHLDQRGSPIRVIGGR